MDMGDFSKFSNGQAKRSRQRGACSFEKKCILHIVFLYILTDFKMVTICCNFVFQRAEFVIFWHKNRFKKQN
jgi:hypothetical protein